MFHTFWLLICKVMRIRIKHIPLMRIRILIIIWCKCGSGFPKWCGFIRIWIQTQQYLHYLGHLPSPLKEHRGCGGKGGSSLVHNALFIFCQDLGGVIYIFTQDWGGVIYIFSQDWQGFIYFLSDLRRSHLYFVRTGEESFIFYPD